MKLTAKDHILAYLQAAGRPVPVHEMIIPNVSQNSIGSRLPEMALAGLVVGEKIDGKPYKSWCIIPKELVLPL